MSEIRIKILSKIEQGTGKNLPSMSEKGLGMSKFKGKQPGQKNLETKIELHTVQITYYNNKYNPHVKILVADVRGYKF